MSNKTDGSLKLCIEEIIKENKFKNANVTFEDVVKSGYLGLPKKIIIREVNENQIVRELNLFMKSAPKTQKTRESVPLRSLFVNEIAMYRDVLQTFLKFQKENGVKNIFDSIPKCYKYCADDKNEFLIFEDLSKSDFVLWDKTKPMSCKQVEFVLKECAKFHAVSFAISVKNVKLYHQLIETLDPTIYDIFKLPEFLPSYFDNFKIALSCFDQEKEKYVYEKLQSFIDNDLISVLEGKYPVFEESVIVHGDNWCNNYMFKLKDPNNFEDIDKMVFLDWQCSRLSSPVIDLSYFLYSNGPQEVFDNLEHYLKIYHEILSLNLKEMNVDVEKVFPFTTLQAHWKKFSQFGFLVAVPLMSMYYDPKHSVALNVSDMIENDLDFINYFTNFKMAENEEYTKRVRGIVYHFVENNFI